MGSPLSATQSTRSRLVTTAKYLLPVLAFLITLHFIRNISPDAGFHLASLTSSSSSLRTSSARLNAPLRDASTSDLIDLLGQRLGNVSIATPQADTPNRANAVLVMLSRNGEVNEAAEAVRQMEDRFNHRFHYPWVFLNDEPFSEEFIQRTSQLTSGKTQYGVIPYDHWNQPDWIDENRARANRNKLVAQNIIYGGSVSYRNMCRFNSGFFFKHELLQPYRFYWRVEPGVQYFCDMEYDPFVMMEQENKVYGFTISLAEWEPTIPTLWKTVKEFTKEFPQYVAPNNSMGFLSNTGGETYNLCHFWSNFEIADMSFWRSEAYTAFFDYLEAAGGFYYERWGDAPVHSIAASLFANKSQVHFFNDIGYRHAPFQRCPQGDFHSSGKCWCDPSDSFDYRPNSCLRKWEETQEGNR